ncbi:MAG: nitroreductase [Burkholderiaceae bacterium]
MTSSEIDTDTDAAILSRMSTRAFTSEAVPRSVISQILSDAVGASALVAPMPWRMHVLQGSILRQLCDEVCTAHDAVRADPDLRTVYREPYDYYPEQWFAPYLERRRENGWGLYGLLGIGKTDKDKMHAQHQRNYRFFHAPVGMFVTMDRKCGGEALLDAGRYLQNVMLQARAHKLHTCPQAAWNMFSPIILPRLGLAGDDIALVCGMALGHADTEAPINSYYTPRLAIADFSHWRG